LALVVEEAEMIDDEVEKQCLVRLNRIQGQIRGIGNMLKERRYCVDIIMQIAAAEAALHKVSEIIMRNHLRTCVQTAFRSRDKKERERMVEELMQVYARYRPR
jgi:DNA-binding FrmR family transcriptional regulator